jgi:hypothetical protein
MKGRSKNIGALMAIAALAGAAMPGGVVVPKAGVVVSGADSVRLQAQGLGERLGGGFNLAQLFSRGGFGGYSGNRGPAYRNRFPISVAQGKRNARKRRNVLRSRGHHRKAVR